MLKKTSLNRLPFLLVTVTGCLTFPLIISAIALETNFQEQGLEMAQTSTPNTYIKVQDFNNLVMQIKESDFRFWGILKRNNNQEFIGTDGQVRVVLNPYNGHVMVFSATTGIEFYNYYIDPVSGVGEAPDTMCDSATESC